MAKTLYLMRHGQTLFNVLKKIQGWCDSPLTEEGIRQAKIARKWFEDNNLYECIIFGEKEKQKYKEKIKCISQKKF